MSKIIKIKVIKPEIKPSILGGSAPLDGFDRTFSKSSDGIKQVTWLGNTWYKNISDQGGAMKSAIDTCNAGNIVVHSQHQKNGRLWGAMPPLNLLNLLNKNYGLYEVITAFPHKVYFDIDGDAECVLNDIKTIILSYFPNAEMAISGSVSAAKISYHIILQNYVIHNEAERIHVKSIVQYICSNVNKNFDWKVYTTNRNMKCINQSKQADPRVQQIIENDDYRTHCITCFINNYALPFLDLPEEVNDIIKIEKSKMPFDLTELPKLNLQIPEHVIFNELEPLDILQLLPLNKSYNHNYTHVVARYCYNNNLPFETFIAWLKQKHETGSAPSDGFDTTFSKSWAMRWKSNWSKLDKFPPVNMFKIKNILAYFYPDIAKDKSYLQFKNSFDLNENLIVKIPTISQTEFKYDKKYLIFNIGMGGGKTTQTGRYLQKVESFCWICPNKALAHNTYDRLLNEFKIDVKHYSNDTTKAKKAQKLLSYNKMVIVANSLHYLFDKTYDVIIIDEVETFIDKWFGIFMENKYKNWQIFLNLIRKSKKVILLDAFITTKTLKLFNNIDKNYNNNVVLFEKILESTTRTANYMSKPSIMIHNIIKDLKAGLKLFIFYPYKNESNYVSEAVSMEALYNTIATETGTTGIYYNADVDEQIKAGIKNVNDTWANVDFIITNSMITCGVNYDKMDFDTAYLFIASFSEPRSIAQVSCRVRHLRSGIINMCFMGAMNQPNSWEIDNLDCPIYNSMLKTILIEKKSPIKKTIQLFVMKAHYKFKMDENKLNTLLDKEIIDMLDKYNNTCSFKGIKDIDEEESKHLQSKIFSCTATMLDKFALNKYFFKRDFTHDAKDAVYNTDDVDYMALEYSWDKKHGFFFDQLRKIKYDINSIFYKIQKLNNLPTIFPVDIKKMKLNKEIIDDIFLSFKFKYISKSSSSTIIIRELYNTYFMKPIIKTTVKGTNSVYEIDLNYWNYWTDFLIKYDNKETPCNYNDCNLFLSLEPEEFDI